MNKTIKLGLLLSISIAIFTTGCNFSTKKKPVNAISTNAREYTVESLEGLDSYINGVLKDWDIPGVAVAVVSKDRLLFAKGFGIKQIGSDARIDEHTLFQIGSTSKAFTAAALGILVQEGKLSWDDPVFEHLPWFKLSDPVRTREVTIRDLLAHRTGVADDMGYALAIFNEEEAMQRLDLLDNSIPFRQQFEYSNFMYGVAGQVVAKVSGMSWGEFVQAQIFKPLSMKSSYTSAYDVWGARYIAPTFAGTASAGKVGIEQALDHNVSMPHGHDRNEGRKVLPWQSYDNLAAGGTIVSNVLDMSRWLRLMVSGGNLEGKHILDKSTVKELLTPQIAVAKKAFIYSDDKTSHGLGWNLTHIEGHSYAFHGGAIFGFPAYAALAPDDGIGVIVLSNGNASNQQYLPHQQITAWVLEHLLGLKARDWRAEALLVGEESTRKFKEMENKRVEDRLLHTKPSLPLSQYAGDYTRDMTGPLSIEMNNEGLLRLYFRGEGAFSGTLEHWQNDTFRLFWDGGDGGPNYGSSFLTFKLDSQGLPSVLDAGILGKYTRISD